ncbi:MAG: DUF1512 domain-containing protein [Candidatus Bathyarchaeia archaeon]
MPDLGLLATLDFLQGLFPVGENNILNVIFQALFISLFMFTMVYGQRMQAWMMLRHIDVSLRRLKAMRDEARRVSLETLKGMGGESTDLEANLDRLLEYFWIPPVDLDPAGIVGKLEHLLDVRDDRLRAEVARLAPKADSSQLSNAENLVEVTLALNTLYRVVRHLYLFGKKTMSIFIIYQLEAQLPLVVQEAEATMAGVQAFQLGQPVGDGAGSLVAARFMYGSEKRTVAKDTVASDVLYEGRRLIVVKAEGPGGNVGKPGDGLVRVLDENGGKASAIIMIDAAQKLEGEETGEVSEGIGAAIGGIGVDKFKIEETAKKYGIPLYAVIIKESSQDVLAPMKKELYKGVDEAIRRVKRIITERSTVGDLVVILGIGNTTGIAQ